MKILDVMASILTPVVIGTTFGFTITRIVETQWIATSLISIGCFFVGWYFGILRRNQEKQ